MPLTEGIHEFDVEIIYLNIFRSGSLWVHRMTPRIFKIDLIDFAEVSF